MKIGILSDLHGNFDATYSVLESARKKGVSILFILGDLVGYYFEPHKILKLLKNWKCYYIIGNHELLLKNYDGREKKNLSFYYAKKDLTKKELQFLFNLPKELSIKINNKLFYLCHSNPKHDDKYLYPSMKKKIVNTFIERPEEVFIFGHTHYQFLYERNGKKILNPGSVGQPRDKKGGACWALYNCSNNTVALLRENYNENAFVKKLKQFDTNLNYRKYFLL